MMESKNLYVLNSLFSFLVKKRRKLFLVYTLIVKTRVGTLLPRHLTPVKTVFQSYIGWLSSL